ncbi:signal peptidase II (plasmid) [Paracoccus versutus]|uniref:Lipoprotein signal peptidase n=1 Tax=Paracoccus versutus TaxID=34007 RepID=A0A3D9XXI8_PARVE|nr:signal peptidase II [Paracoccus versutus]WGR55106.1 signal peptidase II [Paracoccus versutus]
MGAAGAALDRPSPRGTDLRPHSLLLVALLVLLLDQASKSAALSLLEQGRPVVVFAGFNLALGFNTGASFGLLAEIMATRPLAMAALTAALTVFFALMALRARHPFEAVGHALIVGGAAGNVLDRLRQGRVTDFLDFYWGDQHWPAFNGADIAIFLGAVLFLLPMAKRT